MLSSSEASSAIHPAGVLTPARVLSLVVAALSSAALGLAGFLFPLPLLVLAAWLASVALLVWTVVMAVAQRRVGPVDTRPELVSAPRAGQLQAADSLENLPVGVVAVSYTHLTLPTNREV